MYYLYPLLFEPLSFEFRFFYNQGVRLFSKFSKAKIFKGLEHSTEPAPRNWQKSSTEFANTIYAVGSVHNLFLHNKEQEKGFGLPSVYACLYFHRSSKCGLTKENWYNFSFFKELYHRMFEELGME